MGGSDGKDLMHNFILRNCLSFDNLVKGFDQNNNRGSMTLYNCTGFRNGTYNFSINATLGVGKSLTIKNSVSLASSGVALMTSAVQENNSWLSPFTVSNSDFISIDPASAYGPRKADGSLPDITFMHLAVGSNLIDTGVDVGIPFTGILPDLGAFEFGMSMPTGVLSIDEDLSTFRLEQNFPNPFNPITVISFQIVEASFVTLKVFDLLGQEIATLVNEEKNPGSYNLKFDGNNLSSGIYFYKIQAGKSFQIKKMILMK